MIKKILSRLGIGVLLWGYLSGCVRPTGLDPAVPPGVVINCVLSYPEQEQRLWLSETFAPNGVGGESIPDADVVLKDETAGVRIGQFSYQEGGYWQINSQVIPSHRYCLSVALKDGRSLSAHTSVPANPEVVYSPFGEEEYSPSHYSSALFQIKTSTLYHTENLPPNPLWVYGLRYDAATRSWSILNRLITDCQAVDPFNQSGGGAISVWDSNSGLGVWERVSFHDAAYHYRYLRIPNPGEYEWSRPRASLLEESAPLVSRPWTRSFYLNGDFGDDFHQDPSFVDKWPYQEDIPSAGPSAGPVLNTGYVVFMFTSDEYDQYLKDVVSFEQKQELRDVTSLYERPSFYNNIEGGHGIFGACIRVYLPWYPPQPNSNGNL